MNQPKISVIVPVYKVEPYLRKCLDSIVNQTYRNLEIILVDDGSPDNCGAICDEYAAKDERILVIHQANAGVSAARNAALDIATGDYIGFVDSDDWLELDMYEYLYTLAKQHDADVTQCGLWEEENGQSIERFVLPNHIILPYGGIFFLPEDWKKTSYNTCCKLYRASVSNGIRYDTQYTYGEDTLYNTQVLLQSNTVVFGADAKYHYFQRQGSACHQPPTVEYILNCQKALIRCLELTRHEESSRSYFLTSIVLTSLDLCSQIVRFYPHSNDAKALLQTFIRKNLVLILRLQGISAKDRLKSLLIAHAWWLYRPLLLANKWMKGREKTWND